MSASTFTYQTRLTLAPDQMTMLDAYAELAGVVERTLFAKFCAGQEVDKLKNSFCAQGDITARQFNAISVGLKGKIDSVKERRSGLLRELDQRITTATKLVKKLSKIPKETRTTKAKSAETAKERESRLFKIHHKKRRLVTLQARYAAMKIDHDSGKVRIAFGSKKLFRSQLALQENGYDSTQQWREDWLSARSAQFLVLGSKDETAGCQGCVATLVESAGTSADSLTLRLRLPESIIDGTSGMARTAKHVLIEGVRFAYGQDNIVAALNSYNVATVVGTTGKSEGKNIRKVSGTALTYRFVKDEKGWRIFVAVAVPAPQTTSTENFGALGVDFNADHLAVAETDRFGNLMNARRFDVNTCGKTSEQTDAIYGDVAVEIARMAVAAAKPTVIEQLDFAKKKAQLETVDRKRSRMLSALCYAKAASMLKAACFRSGVTVIEVNPAYTSVIGALNFAQRFGVSTHQGAAFAIARRGGFGKKGLRERPVRRVGLLPIRNGGHVAFDLPVRNRSKHVWTCSGQGLVANSQRLLQSTIGARGRNPCRLRP